MRPSRLAVLILVGSVAMTAAPAANADALPESLTVPFLTSTPSLVWQGRMPTPAEVGAALGSSTSAVSAGWPEYRTTTIIGGGGFAKAPGFLGKVNSFWIDPKVNDGAVQLSINVAAFADVSQATAAVGQDGKLTGVPAKAMAAQGTLQRWQGQVTNSSGKQVWAWVMSPSPAPMVVRMACIAIGPTSLYKQCDARRVNALALRIAGSTTTAEALPPSVLADLPTTPPGVQPVLAVSQPSIAAWDVLIPTKPLRAALANTSTTVLQYSPTAASPMAITALVTPLATPQSASTFVTQICGGFEPDTTCKKRSVSQTSSGIPVIGQTATIRQKDKGAVTARLTQAAGAGVLVMVSCEDLQTYGPLSAADDQICATAVPALVDALLARQQQ